MFHTGTIQYNFFGPVGSLKKSLKILRISNGRKVILRRILTYRLVVNFRSLGVIQPNGGRYFVKCQIRDKDTVKPEKSKSSNFLFMWIRDQIIGLTGFVNVVLCSSNKHFRTWAIKE